MPAPAWRGTPPPLGWGRPHRLHQRGKTVNLQVNAYLTPTMVAYPTGCTDGRPREATPGRRAMTRRPAEQRFLALSAVRLGAVEHELGRERCRPAAGKVIRDFVVGIGFVIDDFGHRIDVGPGSGSAVYFTTPVVGLHRRDIPAELRQGLTCGSPQHSAPSTRTGSALLSTGSCAAKSRQAATATSRFSP